MVATEWSLASTCAAKALRADTYYLTLRLAPRYFTVPCMLFDRILIQILMCRLPLTYSNGYETHNFFIDWVIQTATSPATLVKLHVRERLVNLTFVCFWGFWRHEVHLWLLD